MGARNLDRIIVVDVESTCWEGNPPHGEISEIIEIGICTLETITWERLSKESILVRPEQSEVSPFCTQLTGLTKEELRLNGIPFTDACRKLKQKYHTRGHPWASYGNYDRQQFKRVCARQSISYPFGSSHLNVKTLFALRQGLIHEVTMAEALRIAGIPLEGRQHRGVDDAWNIARLLATIFKTQNE